MRARFLLVLSLSLVACDGGAGPMLAPIAPATARVNEALRIELLVDNPSGAAVDLRVEAGNIPSFDAVTTLSAHPSGGTFTWTPLSSHVGMHELTFLLTAGPGGDEYDRQTVLVDVRPAEDAAPVFVAPGAGGTFDLTANPCVTFDVEVRDDDSASVDIRTRSELPERATLANGGPKRAMFDWCPTPDQVAASERWTIQLAADDGDHPVVEHDFVVVLRSGGGRDGCPGEPPVITLRSPIENERVTTNGALAVEIRVTDDLGLRDAPLLHYTTEAPADRDNPDVTRFELATFEDQGGGAYRARIPSLGLAQGEEKDVYYLVSATDNDDATGSLCDHRTDSPLVAFVAVGGAGGGGLAECEPCSSSMECSSGICAATAGGGRCVDACSGDGICDEGACGATVTTEGATRAGCGPASEICGSSGGSCIDDAREDDDTPTTATRYTGPIVDGQICPDDDDYFAIEVPDGNRVTVTLDRFDAATADLDLQLSRGGTILATSASVRNVEQVSYCNGDGAGTFHARVYGYAGAQSAYALEADVAPDAAGCCTDDPHEDDDTLASARSISLPPGVFDGTICPYDDDWGKFTVSSPSQVEVTIAFELPGPGDPPGDLDLELYAADGRLLAWSRGIGDVESLTANVPAGTYAIRVYGYRESTNEYAGEVVVR